MATRSTSRSSAGRPGRRSTPRPAHAVARPVLDHHRYGSTLTDLAGHRAHYGQASRRYDLVIELPSPGLTSVVIAALPAGTWYFAVKAYRATGTESNYSGEAAKTIG